MLPGFRFLFAAITLAVSLLVFGLGAAALLRATHEQFVNVHTVRPAAITLLARSPEAPMPSLSMLRIDSPPPPAVIAQPAAIAPLAAQAPMQAAPAEPAPVAIDSASPSSGSASATPETDYPSLIAALQPDAPAMPEVAPPAELTPKTQAPDTSIADIPATPEPQATVTDAANQNGPQAGAEVPSAATPAAETRSAAAPEPVAEPLPEVEPLTGPIPTPRRDPRVRTRTAATAPAANEPAPAAAASPDIASPASASPTASSPAADTPDITGSIGDTLPPPGATPLPVARPNPEARRPAKQRRQIVRRRTVQPQSDSGL
ncbi:hypothetical protein [Rhodopseudomonas palustris]|uniref:hypothetical protein n=1 Tax=Rhodopseudomonas palustris TaxID=1076 RepID=UPI0006419976|nr:hypothetical protein [Rhodopseudomonas palustris]